MTNAVESITIDVCEKHNGLNVTKVAATARSKTFHRICRKISRVVFCCW
jgi:hypothetical protein